ncbi:MAG: hypothetical protein LBK12_02660 [Odoribacteraceae bacterium]|nr:hypothetical protein [Odoribacteraceae bacterium]
MKKKFLILSLLSLLFAGELFAQSMPVVFDKRYGEGGKLQQITFVAGDEIAFTGKKDGGLFLSWLDRAGAVVFSKTMAGFTEINQLKELAGEHLLVVGQSSNLKARMATKGKKSDEAVETALVGRALILNRAGELIADYYVGDPGTSLLQGELTRDKEVILAGYEKRRDGKRRGILTKLGESGRVIYKYISPHGSVCSRFEVLGHATEYVCAAFSTDEDAAAASVVRLDNHGKPYYMTLLPAKGFTCTGINARAMDGSMLVIGHSTHEGVIIYKVRPEGDIVFAKTIVPATGQSLEFLHVSRAGTILAGGNDGTQGYYAMLREDGTTLFSRRVDGGVSCLKMDPGTGGAIVTAFDPVTGSGSLIKLSDGGKVEFETAVDGFFDNIRITPSGEAMLLSRLEGRVSVYSSFGALLSDGYIAGKKASAYDGSLIATSGEAIFWGMDNRVVKLGHGLYISDVKITKPVNGVATALFTVTLTGFATNAEGVALPVSVAYATRPGSASEADHFVPINGRLSFIPAKGDASRYQMKQEVEIPIKANDRVEGTKEFEVRLSGVEQSYLIKSSGKGMIEDQQALVKLVRVEDGIEGMKDVVYEVGLFKTDGTPLSNATGTDIVLDGNYGEGTADALDFDMSVPPRVVIPNGRHSGKFNVKTLEDTRYELPKSVIVNFTKAYSLNGTKVSFEGAQLACTGTVIDQPAVLVLSSLGDHRVNNNVVSGFFTLSLCRASDGAPITNATGAEITISLAIDPATTAREGKDFVLTNQHDLRVDGTGGHGSVNLYGVVLHDSSSEDHVLKMSIERVDAPTGALPVTVKPEGKSASFTIKR